MKTIIEEDFDFGFSAISEEDLAQKELEAETRGKLEAQAEVEKYKNQVKALQKLITPLIKNLSKNADKDYIYWPNRDKKLQEFKNKVDAITKE